MLSGLANDGTLLIASRFIKGVSAAFTAPAALSIITTSFAEGRARNKALAVFTATGAVGFSLGLVFGGMLTDIGWRWVFFLPAPVALVVLLAGIKLVPRATGRRQAARSLDIFGAGRIDRGDAAPRLHARGGGRAGFLSLRTLGSLVAVAGSSPPSCGRSGVRPRRSCGSGSSARATSCGRTSARWRSSAGWVGFQFVTTLYLQGVLGWSPLQTGLAIFPGGALVVLLSPAILPLIAPVRDHQADRSRPLRRGRRLRALPADRARLTYVADMLPTFLLAGSASLSPSAR